MNSTPQNIRILSNLGFNCKKGTVVINDDSGEYVKSYSIFKLGFRL